MANPHSFIIWKIFNHGKLGSFIVCISKHNLYIINDNLDSLPNNNFDQNDRILILDLFDKMVKPTLLYGCEIWGLGNIEIIERVHIKFCKLLLQLKNLTPTYMIYGELGSYPIVLDVKIRILSFWSKLGFCGIFSLWVP
jgi:hypothetical protein